MVINFLHGKYAPLRMQPRCHGVVREWSSQEPNTQNYICYQPSYERRRRRRWALTNKTYFCSCVMHSNVCTAVSTHNSESLAFSRWPALAVLSTVGVPQKWHLALSDPPPPSPSWCLAAFVQSLQYLSLTRQGCVCTLITFKAREALRTLWSTWRWVRPMRWKTTSKYFTWSALKNMLTVDFYRYILAASWADMEG